QWNFASDQRIRTALSIEKQWNLCGARKRRIVCTCRRRIAPSGETQSQRVEPDKAVGLALVVDSVLLKSDVAEAVEALRRTAADDTGRALVELEPHLTLDMLLALVDQRLQHLALGREPEAVVDQLGIARHQLVLQMRGTAVECQAFDPAMGGLQD